jgi:ATP-dependent RNA helicase SUPV3L1/SUV3
MMPISFSSPTVRDARARGHGVTAVLGPTNTGKTHLAIERMLGHSSGMIGLPLRLLAREVYNKVVERVGADAVALVTGEEKIKPAHPRFWVATVEAMPRDIDVAFVAIDEVQLGADLERGHVFTDRMLNQRGREETLVLGAATMRPIVDKLLPGANTISRPRLSQLTFAGEKKISRQPRRTAIVTFSAEEVYAIAELVRRQRGGAAVVLGALSPRTRNAQVALYQSGDVDYLVATDAIGMGLNLDVDHIAFAADRKFDGYQYRRLSPAELAQIAGRAGRATRDGSFGTTGRCPPFEPETVQALESHAFESVKVLQWRNSSLNFSSLGALSASLAETPTQTGLTRAPIGEDILVLEHAARDDDVRAVAKDAAAIERLWEVCQVPDYRKISPSAHAELVVTLYGFLMREGKIPIDWFARHVAFADHVEGDIDTLSNRIAHIRTWTFAANRPDWLGDPEHWQGVTRAIEDKLSDALHERLAERFIDRRTSVLMRRMRENTMLETEVTKTGEVVVEGHVIGRLDGFRFAPDATAASADSKALAAAAQRALAGEIEARANRLSHAPDSQFVLASNGLIRWMGEPVAKLLPGENIVRPRVRVLADEQLTGAALEHVQTRLDLWTRTHIERVLAPLFVLGVADDITGIARGIAFQIVESLGVLERQRVAEDVKSLDQGQRAILRKHGVRFGAYHIYVPTLLKPAPRALAAELWVLKHGEADTAGLDDLQRLAASGRTSFPVDKAISRALYRTIGYRACGERAVRVDILERLADLIRPALSWRPNSPGIKPPGALDETGFTVTQAMTSLTGSSGEDFASILRALGYRMEKRPKPIEPEPPAEPAATEPAGVAATAETEAAAAATETEAPSIVDEPPGAAEPAEASAASEAMTEEPVDGGVAEAATDPLDATADTGNGHAELNNAPAIAEPAVDIRPCARSLSEQESSNSEPEDTADEQAGSAAVADDADAERSDHEAPAATAEASDDADAEQSDHEAPAATAEAETSPEERPAEAAEADTGESAELAAEAADGGPDIAAASEQGPEAASPPPTAPASEEPQFIEVWRPVRHEERRHAKRHPRASARPAQPSHATAASASEPAMQSGEQPATTTESGSGAPHRAGGRRHPDRPDRGPRQNRPHRAERAGNEGGKRGEQPLFREQRRERREKVPDPNSPFAKLAALKALLEANAKEGR